MEEKQKRLKLLDDLAKKPITEYTDTEIEALAILTLEAYLIRQTS